MTLSATPPPWPVKYHPDVARPGGRKTSEDGGRERRVERARARLRFLRHSLLGAGVRETETQLRLAAYEMTQSDWEAAEALEIAVRSFRGWRQRRGLWSKYVRRTMR